MKILRTIQLALLCIMLTVTLAACGSNKEAAATPSVTSVSSEPMSAPASASSESSSSPEMTEDMPSASAASHEHVSESASAEPEPSESKSVPSVEPSKEPSAEPSQESEAHEQTVVVEIKDFAFSPSEITVHKGTTVQFINRDKVKHTATADGGEFDTGLLGKDVSAEVKFDDAGTFTYYCTPHPGMTAKIIVDDK
jgi:plastocyanin